MHPRIITIEGLIGCGKTTAGDALSKELTDRGIPHQLYTEKINFDLLSLFLQDMKRYAFAFQLSMLESRINMQREAYGLIERDPHAIAILDRSMIGDRAFARLQYERGNINEEEWNVYQSVYEAGSDTLPGKVIYLDCQLDTAMQRIQRRNRLNEVLDYDRKYLDDLDRCYESSLKTTYLVSVTRLAWSIDRNEREIIRSLLEALNLQ